MGEVIRSVLLVESRNRRTVRLLAGKKTSGEPVFESVLGDAPDGCNEFRVLATPGLVLGVAAGDRLRVDEGSGTFEILSRGGNVSIQFYGSQAAADSLLSKIETLGGWLDGHKSGLWIFTISAAGGFTELERVLNSVTEDHSGVEWYYGNVYDEKDGVTPLNWWK
ncbi:DUF4265 domain-containing protein [Streptomyces sp. L2]|uniref:DUF4265 domain-containing protein n=1 Tax=Streptomyces sp. L2 TaxID=2162665 RepID=UPI0010111B0E|nr:DUF4265 domain-containing protein [Streptomyces sp. L2]